MPRILVDILPAAGHFYGSLKLIQKLSGSGYDVVYLNMGAMKATMDKYGFQTCSQTSFIINPVLLNKQKFNVKLFADRLLMGNKELENNNKLSFQKFEDFINVLSPDLVLLDEQNMLKAIYYELLGIPVICIETKPEPMMETNVPPFTSSYVPSDTALSRFYCKWLWGLKTSKNYFRLKKKQLNYFGQDDYSTALRVARRFEQDLKSRIDLKRSYGIGIKGISRLILSPADFDFPGAEKDHTFRIGPLVDLKREGEIDKPRYASLLKKIQMYKESKEGNVVYCSMGTITSKFTKQISAFFKKMMQVARLNPADLFVLSTGAAFDINKLFPSPANVFIFKTVPQIDLLKYCDIMVTHGGINSITECIFHGVPTLNYPLSYEWDQPGCAARTAYHKLGIKGSLRYDSARVISKKLNRLKSNYVWYRQNVLGMREKFEIKNQSDQALDIIQNIVGGYDIECQKVYE